MTIEALEGDPPAVGADELMLEVRQGVGYVTVNRPAARNAVSTPIIERLLAFLDRIKTDDAVRVVLIQATGRSFIAGGDLKLFAAGLDMTTQERAEDMGRRAARAGRLCSALAAVPQPVIVAARGATVGVGVSILCAADLAIASETAQFRLSHIHLGLSPDGAATYFLPRQAGLKRANAVAMLGDAVPAQEALSMGLLNWVVPDDELDERAERLAQRLAASPPTALAEIKALFRNSFNRDIAGQVAAETASLQTCAATPDYAEGLRAILDKRPPSFGKPAASAD